MNLTLVTQTGLTDTGYTSSTTQQTNTVSVGIIYVGEAVYSSTVLYFLRYFYFFSEMLYFLLHYIYQPANILQIQHAYMCMT